MSVGWSKLCHKIELELVDLTTKLPVSRSWAMGLGKELGKEGEDQRGVEVPEVLRWRDASSAVIESVALRLGMGFRRLATQTMD